MNITIKNDMFIEYIRAVPLALAFERVVEAAIYRRYNTLQRPVLDLGCGEGVFAALAFTERLDYGIEPNPRELERARERNSHQQLICCSGDAIPLPSSSIATIVSNSVLEHIPDLCSVLREAHRILQPNGKLIATVPTDMFERYTACASLLRLLQMDALAERFQRRYNTFWRHYHAYPPAQWQRLFEENGFETVTRHEYQPRLACLINDMLVPLAFLGFLIKKLTNRWFLFPMLRNITAMLFSPLKPFLRRAEEANPGGLVFFLLRKRDG